MKIIEEEFIKLINKNKKSSVASAMQYSFLCGGKRLRPKLLLEICKSYGISSERSMPFALALEMIHTYSLIHDDLPAIDNDNIRRGKNTCHVQFNEATAILAGDGLLNEAIKLISMCDENSEIKIKCIEYLLDASGINGMIYGQIQDIESENKEICWEKLLDIHINKTGKLFAAACLMAAIIANRNDDLARWESFGTNLGLLFQIQDDILDISKSTIELGKSTSDNINNKSTSVSILGIDKAKSLLKIKFQDLYKMLDEFDVDMSNIKELIKNIETRQY
ncbi:MAG: polyprenyl synthetase family protein [Anaerorhabdus sp.]